MLTSQQEKASMNCEIKNSLRNMTKHLVSHWCFKLNFYLFLLVNILQLKVRIIVKKTTYLDISRRWLKSFELKMFVLLFILFLDTRKLWNVLSQMHSPVFWCLILEGLIFLVFWDQELFTTPLYKVVGGFLYFWIYFSILN